MRLPNSTTWACAPVPRSRRQSPALAARDNTAFTVVELLVVVAILALLMAILTPMFQGVRTQAISVNCGANLHQIGLAFAKRSADGRLTAAGVSGSRKYYPPSGEWPSVPYGNCPEPGIFACPATGNTVGESAAPGIPALLSGIVYENRYQGTSFRLDDPNLLGYGHQHVAVLVDHQAQTIEFCVEDVDPPVMSIRDQGDDGAVRITLSTFPPMAELIDGGCAAGHNCLLLNGKPMFPQWEGKPADPPDWYDPTSIIGPGGYYGYTGWDRRKIGQRVPLNVMVCDYGINRDASLLTPGENQAVVLDYGDRVVDYDAGTAPGKIRNVAAARHGGTVNVLRGGGSVANVGPAALDYTMPGVTAAWWRQP